MSFDNEYKNVTSGVYTESVWCPFCFGLGLRRHRASGMDPRVQVKTCTRCKGRKKIWVQKYSELWEKSRRFVPGLGPGIRKSKL